MVRLEPKWEPSPAMVFLLLRSLVVVSSPVESLPLLLDLEGLISISGIKAFDGWGAHIIFFNLSMAATLEGERENGESWYRLKRSAM